MVWRDAWFSMTTCPVRALTPEVKDVLAWFDRTHALQVGFGVVRWQATHVLPGPGGAGDQDARLMAALEWTRDLKNALLLDRPERRQASEETDDEDESDSDRTRRAARKRVRAPRV